MYTASTAFLEALDEAGVSCIFANFGSDHPALVEALAEARATGRKVPALYTCPNEMVALSAAHGHAQASGQAQAVVVHVECGTQALAGAMHNAAKGRVPVLIFAGLSPFTQEGEARGSRNEFIQWIQDVFDQPGIVRGYVKYENQFRSPGNIRQITWRALQFAHSDPQGPVYLTGAREVMEAEATETARRAAEFRPIAPCALPPDGLDALVGALRAARRPLAVTSFLGRNPAAVGELVRLAQRLGMGVLESVPNRVNFPAGDPLYQGNQWNQPRQNEALAGADLVLVLDSDVPWIPSVSRPAEDAAIYHIDIDPLKQQMPLWYIAARGVFRADAATALGQINRAFDATPPDPGPAAASRAHYTRRPAARGAALAEREACPTGEITVEYLLACLRDRIDAQTIVLNEAISSYHSVIDHLRLDRPGAMYTSGGGSLGWHGGAAIGVKLALPEADVVAITGDGSYMFSVPSSVHWMARHYRTPFLTVVLNNRGWKSPKLSALAVHPQGHASRANEIGVSFDPPPDYAAIAAAAGGAHARTLRRPEEVAPALAEALAVVREDKRCAVLDVWLAHL